MPNTYVDKMEKRLMRNMNCENQVTFNDGRINGDSSSELKQVIVDV